MKHLALYVQFQHRHTQFTLAYGHTVIWQPPPCDITWLGPASARRALASYVSLAASLSSPHFFYLLPTSCPTFQDRGRFSFLSSSICSKREVLYAIRCFILFLFHSVLIFRWGNCFIINFVEIEIKCIIFHPNLRCNKLPKKNVSSILQWCKQPDD